MTEVRRSIPEAVVVDARRLFGRGDGVNREKLMLVTWVLV